MLLTNRVAGSINWLIGAVYIVGVVRHMIWPRDNFRYSQVLVVNCIGTIPLICLLWLGRSIVEGIPGVLRGPVSWPGAIAYILFVGLFLVLPFLLLIGLANVQGYAFVALLIGIVFPLIWRIVTTTDDMRGGIVIRRILLFLGSAFIALGVHFILWICRVNLNRQERHFLKVWPGYSDPATVFLWICIFALLSQWADMRYSYRSFMRQPPATAELRPTREPERL